MSSYLHEFRKHLAAKGQRLTSERQIVAETVFSLSSPFRGETVVTELKTTNRISRAAVFRALKSLMECGLISVRSGSDFDRQYYHS